MSQFFKGAAGGGPIGNVMGTPPSTDNAIARYDGATGFVIQNSTILIDDDGNLNSTATFSGSTKFFLLQNNVNTASSSAKVSQLVGGTSAGDVYDEFRIGTARAYSFGVDNDDSQTFKLTTDASGNVDPSSGTTLLDITSAGQVSFPSATLTENGLMLVGASGLLESLGNATNGQIPIGSTGSDPVLATLTAGSGIGIVNAAGTITISSTGSMTWSVVINATQAMAVNNGYIGNRGTPITFTLPDTASVGDVVQVTNIGAGLPVIAQNAGESINFVSSTTTVGVGGSLTAVDQFASIELVCVVANTTWNVVDSTGNWTVV